MLRVAVVGALHQVADADVPAAGPVVVVIAGEQVHERVDADVERVAQAGGEDLQVTADDRARQDRYAQQAVAALRAARANAYKDVQNLEVEPDLDPIRTDSGFNSLMQDFRKP